MKKILLSFLLIFILVGCSKKGFYLDKRTIKREGYQTEKGIAIISDDINDDNVYLSFAKNKVLIGFRKKTSQTDLYSIYLNYNLPKEKRLFVLLRFDEGKDIVRAAYWVSGSNGLNALILQDPILDDSIDDTELIENISKSKFVTIFIFDEKRENAKQCKFDISNYKEMRQKREDEFKK